MARWQDVAEAERKARSAQAARDSALLDLELYRAFINETGQRDAFLEWHAKRCGVHEAIYG